MTKANVLRCNQILRSAHQLDLTPKEIEEPKGELRAGVDLGTSSIVFVVVDQDDKPLVCLTQEAQVIKDGLIVDFFAAVKIVKALKQQAESIIKQSIPSVAGAIPPLTIGNNKAAVGHVIEGAGFEVSGIFDEPEAAAKVLSLDEGAVIDIGGGTTGISIFEEGRPVFTADEATGGHHMTLVLAGHHQITLEEGEARKRDDNHMEETFQIIRPVIEKMGSLSRQFIAEFGKPVDELYLVGGATMFPKFVDVFQKQTTSQVYHPVYPRFVTPLGIAMLSNTF
ncbi:ethanolamine utilization protein EutJ [Amphibacillus sp. Q70]|uniref:ethanolamine utilization protein EutJ n=1 Tax=Amphibacillus sp. Q70 TaxID=3453416 RepID=UPI003F83651F